MLWSLLRLVQFNFSDFSFRRSNQPRVFREALETPGTLRCFAMRRLAASRAFPALPCAMRKTFDRRPRSVGSRQGAGRWKANAFQKRQRGWAAKAAGTPRVVSGWFRLCSVTSARRHENRGALPRASSRQTPHASLNLTPPMCVSYREVRKSQSQDLRLSRRLE